MEAATRGRGEGANHLTGDSQLLARLVGVGRLRGREQRLRIGESSLCRSCCVSIGRASPGLRSPNRYPASPAADNRLAVEAQIRSLRSNPLRPRNATFFDALLALIRISSPVAGLRPLRAGRAGRMRTCRTPRLGMRILLPFFSTRPMSATKPVNISIACFLAIP